MSYPPLQIAFRIRPHPFTRVNPFENFGLEFFFRRGMERLHVSIQNATRETCSPNEKHRQRKSHFLQVVIRSRGAQIEKPCSCVSHLSRPNAVHQWR